MDAAGAFCFPAQCTICRQGLIEGEHHFCAACDQRLDDLSQKRHCPGCAHPLGDGAVCVTCGGRGIRPIRQIACLGKYAEPLRGLILGLKYRHRWGVADLIAGRMAEIHRVREVMGPADCLVPVPMHWRRRFLRGYNQAELVARAMGRQWRVDVVQPAVRTRLTPTQTGIRSHDKRLANQRGAFELERPELIHRRHVVLVDDVMTSSATLRSVARCLLAARPASICAVVVAVADPKRQAFEVV